MSRRWSVVGVRGSVRTFVYMNARAISLLPFGVVRFLSLSSTVPDAVEERHQFPLRRGGGIAPRSLRIMVSQNTLDGNCVVTIRIQPPGGPAANTTLVVTIGAAFNGVTPATGSATAVVLPAESRISVSADTSAATAGAVGLNVSFDLITE